MYDSMQVRWLNPGIIFWWVIDMWIVMNHEWIFVYSIFIRLTKMMTYKINLLDIHSFHPYIIYYGLDILFWWYYYCTINMWLNRQKHNLIIHPSLATLVRALRACSLTLTFSVRHKTRRFAPSFVSNWKQGCVCRRLRIRSLFTDWFI